MFRSQSSRCIKHAHAVRSAHSPPVPGWQSLGALLLDVDGTLCDSDSLHFIAFQELCSEHNVFNEAISWKFFKSNLSGVHNSVILQHLFPGKALSEHAHLAEQKEARFRELLQSEGLSPLNGLPQFLQQARHNDVSIAAVTNAPRENAESMLAALGMPELNNSLVVGNECSQPKPSHVPYTHACGTLCNSLPENALAFEDSTSGIQSAVNAGVAVIGVRTSQDAHALLDAGATATIEDFADNELRSLLNAN